MNQQHVELTASDAATIQIMRGRKVMDTVHIGPNAVHACICRADGSYEDLGISYNVLTTSSGAGRDQIANAMGGVLPTGGQGSPNTAAAAGSITATGTPWTVNQLAGMQVVSPVTGITTVPVFGYIISNTTSVATIDKWHNPDDTTGATPAAANAFIILPGAAPCRYMAITENASAAAAGDTVLTGEITTGGAARALATFAHTLGTNTYTLQKVFSITATFPAIHKMGIFHSATGTAGVMLYESVLNADASVVSGDSLTVTETVTIS